MYKVKNCDLETRRPREELWGCDGLPTKYEPGYNIVDWQGAGSTH